MDLSAGSNNRAFSCDETSSSTIHQTLLESGEESSDLSNSEDEETFGETTQVRYLTIKFNKNFSEKIKEVF